MKVKPYRRCDICNDDYLKVKNCMKIKQYSVPLDSGRFENIDVCPTCSKLMIKWIRKQRWECDEE